MENFSHHSYKQERKASRQRGKSFSQYKFISKGKDENDHDKKIDEKSKDQGIQKQQELKKLISLTKKLDKGKLQEKACRHLKDALLYRTVRNDLDELDMNKKFDLLIYKLQNSSMWNDFLLCLSWIYIIISFFEPVNRLDKNLDRNQFYTTLGIEIFIITLQAFDFAMEIIQRRSQIDRKQNIIKTLLTKKKTLFRTLFFLMILADLLQYVAYYPQNTVRFARVVRPLQIIIYSKTIRRSFQGIVNSAFNLLVILIFYFIVIFLWAYLGHNIIDFDNNFEDIWITVNNLYIVSTFDFWPDIMLNVVDSSQYYLLYFIPYILIFLLLFLPIPVAVVYEGFRKHRQNLFIADRIKRRIALLNCFQCLINQNDNEQFITKEKFIQFFTYVYNQVDLEEYAEKTAISLFEYLDDKKSNRITIEPFFNIVDIIEQNRNFRLDKIKPLRKWIQFRIYVNSKINLSQIISSKYFEYLMFFNIIASCSIIIAQLFVSEDDTLSILDIIDNIFLFVFSMECLLRIITYGLDEYFQDSWNTFDFFLIISQVVYEVSFYSVLQNPIFKSLSASRFIKLAKIQKVFRIIRAFRTIKIVNLFLEGLSIVNKVHQMFYQIVVCIPIIIKLSVICFIVFYIYSVIGLEIFTTLPPVQYKKTTYGNSMCPLKYIVQSPDFDNNTCQYANFNSFLGAFLVLLQVTLAAGWSNIVYDYGYKLDNLFLSVIYFNSFYFISVFILALIGGIIWEIFIVIENAINNLQMIEEEEEINKKINEQQQIIVKNFNKASTDNQDNIIEVVYNLANLDQNNNNFNRLSTNLNSNPKLQDQNAKGFKKKVSKIFDKLQFEKLLQNNQFNDQHLKKAITLCKQMKQNSKEKAQLILKNEFFFYNREDSQFFKSFRKLIKNVDEKKTINDILQNKKISDGKKNNKLLFLINIKIQMLSVKQMNNYQRVNNSNILKYLMEFKIYNNNLLMKIIKQEHQYRK